VSREVIQNTDRLLVMSHFDDLLSEALHEATKVILVRRAVELKVATVFDALRDSTVDAEATLLSSLHRLLPQRHSEAFTSVVPGLLLVHVRVEGGLIKVDHWPAFDDPVRHSHGKLNTLCFQH
jgi:hypothetical protein